GQVALLDLRGALHRVDHRVAAAGAQGDHQRGDAGDHRGQRQDDHQPGEDAGVAEAGAGSRVHSGAKKALAWSTAMFSSSLRTTRSWISVRPWPWSASALRVSGNSSVASAAISRSSG